MPTSVCPGNDLPTEIRGQLESSKEATPSSGGGKQPQKKQESSQAQV